MGPNPSWEYQDAIFLTTRICMLDAWKKFQKHYPKWWWKMVMCHGTIPKKTQTESKKTGDVLLGGIERSAFFAF